MKVQPTPRLCLALVAFGVLAVTSCSLLPMPLSWYTFLEEGPPTSFFDDCEADYQGYSAGQYYEPRAKLSTEWYRSYSHSIVIEAGHQVTTTVNVTSPGNVYFYFAYADWYDWFDLYVDGSWTSWQYYAGDVYRFELTPGWHQIQFVNNGYEQWDKVFLDDLSLEFPPPDPVW